MHGDLGNAVNVLRLWNARGFKDCRRDVDAMRELAANAAFLLDAFGPGDDHRIANTAQVRSHLLAPLKRRVSCPRPRGGIMRIHAWAAPFVEAAVLFDRLQLLIGGERDAVLGRNFVERAGFCPLHARAVIAPYIDDERVICDAHVLDGLDDAAYGIIRVLLIPGIHFHLVGVQLLGRGRDRVPSRKRRGARSEFRIRRNHTKFFLAGKGLFAQLVPALVELALVFVAPLPRHLMRRMTGAGREI